MPLITKQLRRTLKILCLNSPHLLEWEDGGNDRNGDPTTSRAQCIYNFSKVATVGEKKFPVFMLAEQPDVLHEDDRMDREVLKDRAEGEWLKPTSEWMAERARRIEEQELASAAFAKQLDNADAASVLKGLLALRNRETRTLRVDREPKS